MKKYIFVFLLLFTSFESNSQSLIFSYDNSGNRIVKTVPPDGNRSLSRLSSQETQSQLSDSVNTNNTIVLIKSDTASMRLVKHMVNEISDYKFGFGVTIYPNASLAQITIVLNSQFADNGFGVVEVITGADENIFSSPTSALRMMFDWSDKPKGIYTLRISSGEYRNQWEVIVE